MVVTWTSLTTPSTGERNSALSTRPRAPRSDSALTAILALIWLRSLSASWRKLNCASLGLAERFADRGTGAPGLLARRGDAALQVDHFAPRGHHFGLRDDVLGGERLEHRDLLAGEREAALQAVDRGIGLGDFAAALLGRRAQRRRRGCRAPGGEPRSSAASSAPTDGAGARAFALRAAPRARSASAFRTRSGQAPRSIAYRRAARAIARG